MNLSAVVELRRELEKEKSRLESLKAAVTNLTVKLDELPRSSARVSRTEKLATQIIDSERRIAELEIELVNQALNLTEEILRRVAGQSANVLLMRYIRIKSFEDIAARLNYSRSYVSRLHRQGVKAFEEAKSNDTNHDRRRPDTSTASAL